MTNRERMRCAIRRQQPDRVPINDAFWDETIDAWRAEGHLPPGVDIDTFFGFEWRVLSLDSSFLFAEQVLEENEDSFVRRNAYEGVKKFKI